MKTKISFDIQERTIANHKDDITKNLRKKYAQESKHLSQLNTYKSCLALVCDWLIVGIFIYVCELWFNPIFYMITILIIAGRQHAALVIVHEAAHFRISPKAWFNDLISDYFAAYPVLFDTHKYRLNHSKHHRFLNTDRDPDWIRKIPLRQWQFPLPISYVFRTYPKFLFVKGPLEWLILSLNFSGIVPISKLLGSYAQRKELVKRLVYYSVVAGIISYMNLWQELLLYWFVPLFFVFPTFQRIRSVAEHFGLEHNHELNSSRNVLAPWYETILFAPHNSNYHLTHHLFPAIPFYNLKKMNNFLMEDKAYCKLAHQNQSYIVSSKYPLRWDLFTKELKAISLPKVS